VKGINVAELITDTITITAEDGTTKDITITINGVNEPADITVLDASITAGNTSITGRATHTDVDTNNVDDVFTVVTGIGAIHGYGTYDVTSSGYWTYHLDNNNTTVKGINLGGLITDTITITAEDGTTKEITITINGVNDPASIITVLDASITAGVTSVTGTSSHTDVDTNNDDDVFTVVSAIQSTNGYGTYEVTSSGDWTYHLNNNNTDVKGINVGEVLIDTITITAEDGTTKDITITINGINDPSYISVLDTSITANIASVTGRATHTDVDTNNVDDVFTVLTAIQSTNGYGTYDVIATGYWTYHLNINNIEVKGINVGGVLTDTITIISEDGTTKEITITINGVNEISDITVLDASITAGITHVTGTSTHTDADTNNVDNVFIAVTDIGSTNGYGTYDVSVTGDWTYHLDNTNTVVKAINLGEALNDTITITTEDGTTKDITITINGVNDDAYITVNNSSIIAGNGSVTGTSTHTDVDNNNNYFKIVTYVASIYGTYSVSINGDWTYYLSELDTRVLGISVNDYLLDTITITAEDGTTKDITITIIGINNPAIITTFDETILAGSNSISGVAEHVDYDNNNDINIFNDVSNIESKNGYGTYYVTTGGIWTYYLDNTNTEVKGINVGELLIDKITITAEDGTEKDISITIIGVNDPAIIIAQDTSIMANIVSISGLATHTDADANNNNNYFNPVSNMVSKNNYGMYDVLANGQWIYHLNTNNQDVLAINVNQALEDTITITSTDGTEKDMKIAIIGVNDPSSITVINTEITAGIDIVSGSATHYDVDNIDNIFKVVDGSIVQYGTYDVLANGQWIYNLNNNNLDVIGININEELEDTIRITTEDGTEKDIKITIHGVNDPAVIILNQEFSIQANGYSIYGQATHTDGDVNNDNNKFIITSVITQYGTYDVSADGVWNYYIDINNPNVLGINLGETLTDIITIISEDGSTKTSTIIIHGVNDAAEIIASDVHTTANIIYISGTATVSDVDSNSTFQSVLNKPFLYGVFNILTDGTWSYYLDTNNTSVLAIMNNELLFDQILITSYDGTDKYFNVIIHGIDNPSTISTTNLAISVGTSFISGTATHTDVDHANDDNVFQVVDVKLTTYGTYDVAQNGVWVYHLDSANAVIIALGHNETINDTFIISSEDGTEKEITVTIHGANDDAVIDVANVTISADISSVSGVAKHTDIDNNNNNDLFRAEFGSLTFGTYDISTDGSWTYILNTNHPSVLGISINEILNDYIPITADDLTTKNIVVTIQGKNDDAVITVDDYSITAGVTSITGIATHTDIDYNNDINKFQIRTGINTVHGTYDVYENGEWKYYLDNTRSEIIALGIGQQTTDTITLISEDGTSKISIITINGINEPAIISADNSIITVGVSYISGIATHTDVDNNNTIDTFINVTGVESTYGTYDVSIDGIWKYYLNSQHIELIKLGLGQTTTDTITITANDGTEKNITITINGINDPAIITGYATLISSNIESVSGVATHEDIDDNNNDNVFVPVSQQVTTLGSYDVSIGGSWVYYLDTANNTIIQLLVGQSMYDSFEITAEDGTTMIINITIQGTFYSNVLLDNNIIYENTQSFVGNFIITTTPGYLNILPPITDGSISGKSFYMEIKDYDSTYFEIVNDDNNTNTYKLNFKPGFLPNFEVKNIFSFNVLIKSTYTDFVYSNSTYHVYITDINDAPANISLSYMSVPNNQYNSVVGQISFTDEDVRPIYEYNFSLSGPDGDKFLITPLQTNNKYSSPSLYLKPGVLPNYSVQQQYEIIIVVTDVDIGNNTTNIIKLTQQTHIINVLESNYFPESNILSGYNVQENIMGTIVGTITTNDSNLTDPSLNLHVYELYGIDSHLFEVVQINILKLKENSSLDFETKSIYEIQIKSSFYHEVNGVLLFGTVTSPVQIIVINTIDSPHEIPTISHDRITTTSLTVPIHNNVLPNKIIHLLDTSNLQIGFTIHIKSTIYNEFKKITNIIDSSSIEVETNFAYSYPVLSTIYIYDLSDITPTIQNQTSGMDIIINEFSYITNSTMDPLYETFSSTITKNAECNLNIPVSQFKDLFLFMAGVTTQNTDEDGLIYAVDSSKWNQLINTAVSSNINIIKNAKIEDSSLIKTNTLSINKYIFYDYVRFLTYNVTGGFTGVIFSNELALRESVKNIDYSFHENIINCLHKPGAGAGVLGGKLGDVMVNGAPGNELGQSYGVFESNSVNISKMVMLSLLNGSPLQQQRVFDAFNNSSNLSNDQWRSLPLVVGDNIKFTITIRPKTTSPLGLSIVPNKTYTINLRMV
jgi:VCBS repeat-containing protein